MMVTNYSINKNGTHYIELANYITYVYNLRDHGLSLPIIYISCDTSKFQ